MLERLEEKWELERLEAVPYYDGLMAGEHEALIRSFAGEPILHDPRRGRMIGVRAFEAYVSELRAWLADHNMSFDPVDHVFMEPRGFEEVVLHLEGEAGRVDLPVAIVADRDSDGRLAELRIYHSIWPLTGRHLHRPPMLQRDPDLRAEGVVAEYQRALAAGDVDAIRRRSSPTATRANPPAASTSTAATMPCAVLRRVFLERRRHRAGALRARPRRARLRARVQRREVGPDGATPGGGSGRLRSGRERQDRGGAHLRRRRPAPGLTRRLTRSAADRRLCRRSLR